MTARFAAKKMHTGNHCSFAAAACASARIGHILDTANMLAVSIFALFLLVVRVILWM